MVCIQCVMSIFLGNCSILIVLQIRGEFMRAVRVFAARPERAVLALAELCEERKDEELVSAPPLIPRTSIPPQTPYTVGSHSLRPKGEDTLLISKSTQPLSGSKVNVSDQVPSRPPPEHMAPRRSHWTSPPPPEASASDHSRFESDLGRGFKLATASSGAREKEFTYNSSSSNSDLLSDEERSDIAESDDVTSIRSYTEGFHDLSTSSHRPRFWLMQEHAAHFTPPLTTTSSDLTSLNTRGRHPDMHSIATMSQRHDNSRRSTSGPSPRAAFAPPTSIRGSAEITYHQPLSLSFPPSRPELEPSTVYYQTASPTAPTEQGLHAETTLPALHPLPHRRGTHTTQYTLRHYLDRPIDSPRVTMQKHSYSPSTTTVIATTPSPTGLDFSPISSSRGQETHGPD